MYVENHTFRTRLTRIAPTPSGYLHAGNIASFVFTVGLARERGAEVLLRIDDMDRDRYRREYLEDVFDTLKFLGIPWDRGPRDAHDFENSWSQRLRLRMYEAHLRRLAAGGSVFACSCSRTEISFAGGRHPRGCLEAARPLDEKGAAWRLAPASDASVRWTEAFWGVRDQMLPEGIAQSVVRKKDGFPAYHLCSVADDAHFGVDAVVRGVDLLDSTLFQLHLAERLGLEAFRSALFVHHPLLRENGGTKLSKSAGALSVMDMRRRGFSPSDVYLAVARMVSSESTASTFEELFGLLRKEWGANSGRTEE